jgi:hypothetical protein
MAADSLNNVIGRGPAASKPTSPLAEGYLYFETDTAQMVRYSGSAWEPVSGSPMVWLFDTSTSDSDPGAGKVRFDNATPASVSVIYVDDSPANASADLSAALAATSGAVVLLHSLNDEANYLLATVNSVADGTGYYKLNVSVEDSGTLPSANDPMELHIFGGGGGGGGGGVTGNITSPMKQLICGAGFYAGLLVDRSGLAAPSGTADAAAADTERQANKWSPGTTTQGYIRGNFSSPALDITMSLDMFCDLKLVDNVDGCFWIGWFDRATPPTDTSGDMSTASEDGAGFRALNGTDTNWQCVTCDGTTQNVVDSGVAVDGNWHDFRVVSDDGGVTYYFYIDDALVATVTANVPRTGQVMRPVMGSSYVTSSAREFRCSYFMAYQGRQTK